MPLPPNDDPYFSAGYKIYEAIWRNMERENSLINDRNNWSVVLSAGLLAAQGALLQQVINLISEDKGPIVIPLMLLVMSITSFIAVFFCFKSRIGVYAAHRQIDELKGSYDSFVNSDGDNVFECDFRLPRPFGNTQNHNWGNATSMTFPLVLMIIWIIFGVIQFSCFITFSTIGYQKSILHVSDTYPVPSLPLPVPRPTR